MKQLRKSDLKEGEIYKQLEFDYIFLYNKNETYNSFNDGTAISIYSTRYHKRWSGNGFEKPMVEATPEEKHWLKVCIEADKFVSYEEAMKTFIPEYVECIRQLTGITIGKILPVKNNMVIDGKFNNYSMKARDIYNYFKPSTKEAYDAQFKEPEFVLPKTWHIKINSEEESVIYKKFFKKVKPEQNWKFWINFVYGFDGINYNNYYFNSKLITFEQFKQYVLKENTTVTEKPKVVFEESKDKVLLHFNQSGKTRIESVQCSEGGVYKIGDKITVFDKTSPNKGKSFTIKSFRWSNDKSKICAVTELHTPNGIGLDKIELYVEPKIIEDFKLPEKWCVKRTIDNFKIINNWCNNNHIDDEHNRYVDSYGYIHSEKCNNSFNSFKRSKGGDQDLSFTEITFEQFKKYVLKDE